MQSIAMAVRSVEIVLPMLDTPSVCAISPLARARQVSTTYLLAMTAIMALIHFLVWSHSARSTRPAKTVGPNTSPVRIMALRTMSSHHTPTMSARRKDPTNPTMMEPPGMTSSAARAVVIVTTMLAMSSATGENIASAAWSNSLTT